MNTLYRWLRKCRLPGFITFAFLLVLLITIYLRLAIVSYQVPQPQAILTLGGSLVRVKFTAEFAQRHPLLDIWLSSAADPNKVCPIFHVADISPSRIHLDYQAVDTVTNFTTLVNTFKHLHIQHLYLVTSDYHMLRAQAIATIVLGSQGIAFTPVPIPTERPLEPWLFAAIDTGRALLWLLTGYTGASLNTYFSSDRFWYKTDS